MIDCTDKEQLLKFCFALNPHRCQELLNDLSLCYAKKG
jgi:hypothetical protein